MPQNIYDDPQFYRGYSQLPRSIEGLSGAPEWSAVRSLLPDLRGARILDLGCGFGAFDRWAVEQGAHSVVGIDLSEQMLTRARELTSNPSIDYRAGDIAQLQIPEQNFDLIYSALAFHYIDDFPGLCRAMRRKLRDGGRLVATIEHPIFSAPGDDQWREVDGRSIWPLDRYLDESMRQRNWFTEGVIRYHRTIASYINTLVANSFQIIELIEWGPDEQQLTEHPEWARERDRPMFLIFAADATG
ncbi:MAG: class I SAM-dependent methyltransferase [Pseudomonadales bacterium]